MNGASDQGVAARGHRRKPGAAPGRVGPIMLACVLLLCAARYVPGQESFIDREPEIKAAYLYNFGKYVEWPARAEAAGGRKADEFVVGIVGKSAVAEHLDRLASSKRLNGKRIVYRRFERPADYVACDMLFIPAGQNASLVSGILKKAGESPVLIVGEDEGFARGQGAIGFYVEQNSVKFEINPKRAERRGLKISSKLLSVGKVVEDK